MELSVLYVVGDLGNGGQERQMYYLSTALHRMGYKVTVVAWNYNKDAKYTALLEKEGVELIQYKEGGSIQKIARTRKLIRERKFDIVHSFTFYLNFYVFLCTLFTKAVGIGGIRNRLKMYKKSTQPLLFILSSFFPRYFVSNNYKYNEDYRLGPFWRKVFVISNALDISKFRYSESSENGTLQTVSMSRLYPEKRIDLLIDVIAELLKKGYKVKHRHAGKGPLHESLIEKANNLGLAENFTFIGETNEVNEFISSANIFILTSYHEGCPNVVMEAMASGRAVLTTDCGDVSYLVNNNENGIIVPVNDLNALVNGMERLINDTTLTATLGKNARAAAEENFSLEKYVANNIALYNKILKN